MRADQFMRTVEYPAVHVFGKNVTAGSKSGQKPAAAVGKPVFKEVLQPILAPAPVAEKPAATLKPVTQANTKPVFKEVPQPTLAPVPAAETTTRKPVNVKPTFREAPVPAMDRDPVASKQAQPTLSPVAEDPVATVKPETQPKPVFKELPKETLAPAPVAKGPAVTETAAENFAVDQMNNFLDDVNTYLDEYNARFGSRKGDLTDAYVGDSQVYLDTVNQKSQAFMAEANSIRAFLTRYGSILNPDLVARITKMLDDSMVQVEQVLKIAQQDNEYWRSWDTDTTQDNPRWGILMNSGNVLGERDNPNTENNSAERVYQKAQKEYGYQQKYAGKTGLELVYLLNFIKDEDEKEWVTGEALRTLGFVEAAKYLEQMEADYSEAVDRSGSKKALESGIALDEEQMAATKASAARFDEILKNYGVESLEGLDDLITQTKGMIAEAQKVQEYVRLSLVKGNADFEEYVKKGLDEANAYSEKNKKTEHMTLSEIKVLAYYIAKDKENGTNLAEQYKAAIKHYLKHRRAQEIADDINGIDIPVIEGLTRIGYGFGSGVVNWGMDLAQNFTNQKIDPTVMQMANGYIGSDSDLNWVDRTLHQAATTLGYMAPSILIAKGTGTGTGVPSLAKAAGSVAMFLGSAGNAYGEALEKGYDKPVARVFSTLVGLSEVTLQNILGGISEFGGLPAVLDGRIDAIKNALLKGAAKYGVRLGGEIAEEELQNFLEPAFRTILFGEKYDMPTVQQIIDTALTAFITTTAIEGPEIVSDTIQEYGDNNALKSATNPVQPAQPSPNTPEVIDTGKIGWDGRVAVEPATGPNVTVDGVTYKLLGYDENGSKVYQDVEVLKEQNVSTKGESGTYAVDKNAEELLENPEKDSTITSKLTVADVKTVQDYMSAQSYMINGKLRTEMPLTEEETALVSRFNETLDKIPVYRGDLQRSLFFEDAADVQEFLIDYTPGETIKYSEFISTTKGKNQYNPDGQVQILIRDSQNGRDISSINDSEQEVVYKTDSEFVVIDVTESDGKYYIWMEEK